MSVSLSPVTNNQSYGTWLARMNQVIAVISTNTVTLDTSAAGGSSSGNGTITGTFGATTLFASAFRGGNLSTSNTFNVISNTNLSNGVLTLTSNSTVSVGTVTTNTWTVNTNNTALNSNNLVINASNAVINATKISVTGNIQFSSGGVVFSDNTSLNTANPVSFSTNTLNTNTVALGYSAITTARVAGLLSTANNLIDQFGVSTYRSVEYLIQLSDGTNTRYEVTKVLLVHDGTTTNMVEFGHVYTGNSVGILSSNIVSGNVCLYVLPQANNTVAKVTRTGIWDPETVGTV